ncbi:hypothetical protein NL676_037649 [Syzygium grande]|nr:hypothetical protein NL676_037649 [Syzygium grande]
MATGASNRGGQSALLPLSLSRSMRMAFDGGFPLGFFKPVLCSCTAIHHHLHNHHRRQLSRAWSNSSGRLHHNQEHLGDREEEEEGAADSTRDKKVKKNFRWSDSNFHLSSGAAQSPPFSDSNSRVFAP